jgi:hypothetical protein
VKFRDDHFQLTWILDLSALIHPFGITLRFECNEDITERFNYQSHGNEDMEQLLTFVVGVDLT